MVTNPDAGDRDRAVVAVYTCLGIDVDDAVAETVNSCGETASGDMKFLERVSGRIG